MAAVRQYSPTACSITDSVNVAGEDVRCPEGQQTLLGGTAFQSISHRQNETLTGWRRSANGGVYFRIEGPEMFKLWPCKFRKKDRYRRLYPLLQGVSLKKN